MAEWEAGRRRPTMDQVFRMAELSGVDIRGAFEAFAPAAAPALDAGVGAWLDQLRGRTSAMELARRSGLSRHAVSRLLQGRTKARLPEFLRLVDAVTGRVSDWIAQFVDIESVPAVAEAHRRSEAARRLGFEEPWAAAVVAALDIPALTERSVAAAQIAERLGLDPEHAARILESLVAAGVVRERGRHWVVDAGATIDMQTTPERMASLKQHWLSVAVERVARPRAGDLSAFTVFSVSEADLDAIRALQRAYYRQVRALVAASEPAERVVLLQMNLFEL